MTNLSGRALMTSALVMVCSLFSGNVIAAAPVINGILNNASYAPASNPIAPGSIVAIFGNDLTDGSSCLPPSCGPTFGSNGKLNTTMAGAQVTVNGTAVPIFYATRGQLGVEIPSEVTGTSATVQVVVAGQSSNTQTITIGSFAPGIFTVSADGKGAGAISHADGSPVNTANPAKPAETVIVYATGLGQVTPAVSTGQIPTGATQTVTTPTVTIDAMPAQVQFSGLSGCCVGLNQINVVVPASIRSGTNDLSLVLSMASQSSNPITVSAAGPPALPQAALAALVLSVSNTNDDAGTIGGTVTLTAASSSTTVSLSSSNPAIASLPASVTVPDGSTQATFTITIKPVSAPTSVTITASAGGVTQTATFSVFPTPPPPPYDY